jgi:hypothetical protein
MAPVFASKFVMMPWSLTRFNFVSKYTHLFFAELFRAPRFMFILKVMGLCKFCTLI